MLVSAGARLKRKCSLHPEGSLPVVQIEKSSSEGLTNIVNHAQARRSWVHLTRGRADHPGNRDDGKGFTVGAASRERPLRIGGIREGRGWQAER